MVPKKRQSCPENWNAVWQHRSTKDIDPSSIKDQINANGFDKEFSYTVSYWCRMVADFQAIT